MKLCDPDTYAQGSLWRAGNAGNLLTTVNVGWTATETGKYWILAQTYSANPQDVLTVNLNSTQFEQTTVTLYSTLFSTTVYSLTQTLSSVMAQQLPQSQPTGLSGMSLPLGIVVIVVLVLIGHLVVRRRKK